MIAPMKRVLACLVLGAMLSSCRDAPVPSPTPSSQLESTGPATVTAGGELRLPDGTSLSVPPGALGKDITIGIERGDEWPPPATHLARIGDPVKVDLAGQVLTSPATLEIPYDSTLLPSDMTHDEVFASFYSEEFGVWIPVGGIADPARRVVVVETTHASWWEIDSWITDALLQGLVAGFKFDLGHVLDAGLAFAGCTGNGTSIIIDEGENFDYMGSCLERDDANKPRIRIVNRRVARIGVNVNPGAVTTNFKAPALALGPLETVSFDADFSNAPKEQPLVVSADIDLGATVGMVLIDFLLGLPGARDAIDKDAQARIVAILYENRLFLDAIADLTRGDATAFVKDLGRALAEVSDEIAEVVVNSAAKGSLLSKLGPILRSNLWVVFTGAGLALQVADAAIQMQVGQGNVKFYSNRPTPLTCGVADIAFCAAVAGIDVALETRDYSRLDAIIDWLTVPCDSTTQDPEGPPPACDGLADGSIIECIAAGAAFGHIVCTDRQTFFGWLADVDRVIGFAYPNLMTRFGPSGVNPVAPAIVIAQSATDPSFIKVFFLVPTGSGWASTGAGFWCYDDAARASFCLTPQEITPYR
jgi:hypothetical protein